MPRGSRTEVNAFERRRWLERLEKGTGVTEIARSAGRDIRVVKRGLVIGQQEAEAAQARTDIVRNRLELHQDDLLDEIRRLRGIVGMWEPRTIKTDDPIKTRLQMALLEHIDRKPLKGLLNDYEQLAIEYRAVLASTEDQLESEESQLLSKFPKEIETHSWAKYIVEWLKERARYPDPLERDYILDPDPNNPGKCHVKYGTSLTLTRLPVGENQAALIVDAHKGLMGTAALRVSTLSDLYGRMKAMSEPAIFELDSLILRRMVPGRCNLCN